MIYVYESRLSEHIVKDNIGQLICLAVPIARSGSQDYLEDEVNGNGSSRIIKLQRPWKVVKESAASFEGKPFLKLHPEEDITVENIKEHQSGHVQNVRADDEKEMLIADIVVTDPEVIELIVSKKMRDISCGYFYDLDDNYTVTSILGEHVALVPEGRAGNTKILDAAFRQFDTFLTEIKVEEVSVGDWLYTSLMTGGNMEFVEVIRIVKNADDRLLLVTNHVDRPLAATLNKDDVVRGLLKDVKPVEYKDPTESDIKKEISEKLGDANFSIKQAKIKDKETPENPEEGLYIYSIYALREDSTVLAGWVGIDREGREGMVSKKSLAAVFTTPDWKEELSEDHLDLIKANVPDFKTIKAQKYTSWLD